MSEKKERPAARRLTVRGVGPRLLTEAGSACAGRTVQIARPLAYMLIAFVSMLLATGCASDPPVPGTSAAEATAPSLPEAQQAPDATVVAGYEVAVPKLGIRSSLVGLGLNPDRTVQVPALDQPGQLGLYDRGPRPVAAGPAVILGHVNGRVDGRAVPGAFARLDTVTEGDRIDVTTPTGPARFEVYRVESVPKEQFPTAEVYGDTAGPELRLVTCGGAYDAANRNYLSNVIAFARMEAP